MTYRPEIDGLRAISVLAVLVFHAGLDVLPGGYVGVDVFFVISGFLIMEISLRHLDAGTFSILGFWMRRARRLLPALAVVLAAVTLAGIMILVPHELVSLGQVLLATGGLLSNVALLFQGGYFGVSGELSPLLHLWSLAVEAQYYLVFPLVLAAIWSLGGLRLVAFAIIVVSCLSLGFAQWAIGRHDFVNFFLLPSRIWELGLGAWLAIALSRGHRPPRPLGDFCAAIGLSMIVWSILAYDTTTPFPGVAALVPVLGAVLILYGTTAPASYLARRLATGPLVMVGAASYSIYLWHQPIYVFARFRLGTETLPPGLAVGLGGLSILIGYASYRYVETPWRRGGSAPSRGAAGLAIATLATISLTGALLIASNGFLWLYAPEDRSLVAQSPLERGQYTVSAVQQSALRRDATARPQRVLIVGDSFSQDFYNMILESRTLRDHDIRTYPVSARCQIVFEPGKILSQGGFGNPNDCQHDWQVLGDDINTALSEVGIVILASSWESWAVEHFPQTLDAMAFGSDQRIYVIGPKYFGPRRARDYLGMPLARRIADRTFIPEPIRNVETRLKALVNTRQADLDIQFVSLTDLYCETPDHCRTFTPDGRLISHDKTHLTPDGAAYLGEQIFRRTALGALIR